MNVHRQALSVAMRGRSFSRMSLDYSPTMVPTGENGATVRMFVYSVFRATPGRAPSRWKHSSSQWTSWPKTWRFT